MCSLVSLPFADSNKPVQWACDADRNTKRWGIWTKVMLSISWGHFDHAAVDQMQTSLHPSSPWQLWEKTTWLEL